MSLPQSPELKRGAISQDEYQTSATLLSRALANDSTSWNRMLQLYSPLVHYWCRSAGLAEADLGDVCQEVFFKLARNLKTYRSETTGSFRGWLRVITRNVLTDHFRRRNRQVPALGGSDGIRIIEGIADQPSHQSAIGPCCNLISIQQFEKEWLVAVLRDIETSFQTKTWAAFWRVTVDDRPVSDVAAELDMKPGTVRVAKARVLKRLRSELLGEFSPSHPFDEKIDRRPQPPSPR